MFTLSAQLTNPMFTLNNHDSSLCQHQRTTYQYDRFTQQKPNPSGTRWTIEWSVRVPLSQAGPCGPSVETQPPRVPPLPPPLPPRTNCFPLARCQWFMMISAVLSARTHTQLHSTQCCAREHAHTSISHFLDLYCELGDVTVIHLWAEEKHH